MTYALDSRVRSFAIYMGDEVQRIEGLISGSVGGGYTKPEADAKFATLTGLDTRINSLLGAAPAALDTLAEIATALGNDANLSATLTAQIATKLNSNLVSTFALTLLDDTSNTAMRTTLGLGTLATLSSVATANITNDAVDNTKLTNMAANTIKGNNTAAAADPRDLTVAQLKTMLALVPNDVAGLVDALAAVAGTDTDYVALYNTARTTP